jgi:hypothetical protein
VSKTVTVKYPKRIKFGAKSYKVHWSAEDWVSRPEDKREDSCWGITDHQKLGIWISPELHPTNQRETLLHEILHVLHACSGGDVVSDVLPKHEHANEAEEFIVSRLEALLMAFLVDNPAVLAFIVIGADEDRTQ